MPAVPYIVRRVLKACGSMGKNPYRRGKRGGRITLAFLLVVLWAGLLAFRGQIQGLFGDDAVEEEVRVEESMFPLPGSTDSAQTAPGAPNSAWRVMTFVPNASTGEEVAHGAGSLPAQSVPELEEPDSGVTARLFYSCSTGCESTACPYIWLRFSQRPDIEDARERRDGTESFYTNVNWGGEGEITMAFRENTGVNVGFDDPSALLPRLRQAREVGFRVNWAGSGWVEYRFSLVGSSAAFAEADRLCAVEQGT